MEYTNFHKIAKKNESKNNYLIQHDILIHKMTNPMVRELIESVIEKLPQKIYIVDYYTLNCPDGCSGKPIYSSIGEAIKAIRGRWHISDEIEQQLTTGKGFALIDFQMEIFVVKIISYTLNQRI